MTRWVILGCGYVGTALARRLVAERRAVTITRRDASEVVRTAAELGAEGQVMDLAEAVPAFAPKTVVVCLAPPGPNPSGEAATLAQATVGSRLVYVSSTAVYASGGGAWVDETWPRIPMTAAGRARLAAEAELPPDAVLLRVAGIYGPGRGIAERLRAGTYRIIGDGRAHVSRIHIDDLIQAIIRAGESSLAGPVNVADDDPAPIGELADSLAERLGVAAPPRVPVETVDGEIAGMLTADRRIANTRMKRELGVVLRYPSARYVEPR